VTVVCFVVVFVFLKVVGVWLCCQEWYVRVVCLVGEKVVGNMLLIRLVFGSRCSGFGCVGGKWWSC